MWIIGFKFSPTRQKKFCMRPRMPNASRCHVCTAPLYVLDPQFALSANLISHGTAFESERPRSHRRLRPQKLVEYWRKIEGTFDCQADLLFGRPRTSEGGKGTDVRPAGRVHPGAATEQKQGEVDERSAIRVSDQRLMIVDGGAVDVHPSPAVRRSRSGSPATRSFVTTQTYDRLGRLTQEIERVQIGKKQEI
jgi:hypothetical protein